MSDMVKTNKKDIKTEVQKKRKTTFDKNAENDIRLAKDVAETEPKVQRKATKAEIDADNRAKEESASSLFDITDRLPSFTQTSSSEKRTAGRPLKYTDALILWGIEIMAYLSIDFRAAAGIARAILHPHGIDFPKYNRFFERCQELTKGMIMAAPVTDARILCRFYMEDAGDRVRRLAVDSTGLTLTNITIWRKHKWNVGPKYRGWLKVHALVDVDSNEIVAFILTKDDVGDEGMLEYLLELADIGEVKYSTLYADAAYSSVDNFKLVCVDRGKEFVTSFKENTTPKNLGCSARGDAARLWCSLPYDEWVKRTGYGTRWKVESAFSDLKRLFSEYIRATTDDGMIREVTWMIKMFNHHKRVRANIMGTTGNGVKIDSANYRTE